MAERKSKPTRKEVITSSEVQVITASDGYVLVTDFRFEFAKGKEESFQAIINRFDAEVNAFRNRGLTKLARLFKVPLKFEDDN